MSAVMHKDTHDASVNSLKVIINNARKAVGTNQQPRNVDEQEVPFSLREVMKLKEKTRNMKASPSRRQIKKERQAAWKKKNEIMEKGMSRPLKPVPEFKQGKKEPDEAFINRIERETQMVIAKAQFEDKYQVDLDATEGTQVKQKTKKSKKNRERLKEKKLKKKQKVIQKIQDKESGFEKLKDDIKFGEIVMEPPSLTAKPRKSANIGELKPGKRNLLLNEIMQQSTSKGMGLSAKPRQIGRTIKRKELAPVQQHLMDKEREKAILQYRELKKQRLERVDT